MASHGVPRVSAKPVTEESRQKEQRQIQEYQQLVESLEHNIKEYGYNQNVFAQTTRILQTNPEYYTVWNHRRLILLNALFPPLDSSPHSATSESAATDGDPALTLIQRELEFLKPLLMGFPKCYWIWNYRFWILEEASHRLPHKASYELWNNELTLINKMLTRDGRNFHGWEYRRVVTSNLDKYRLENTSILGDEFDYTTRMINVNLSNFSAWHRRSKLLPLVLERNGADNVERRKRLHSEFDLLQAALWTDPYNQSAWFYHRWVMSNVTFALAKTQQLSPTDYIFPNLTSEEALRIFNSQVSSLREIAAFTPDCKWIFDSLLQYMSASYQWRNSDDVDSEELLGWLSKLLVLDPLRRGRWADWKGTLEGAKGK